MTAQLDRPAPSVPMERPGNPLARRRAVWMVVGALPALIALAVVLRIGLMLHDNAAGRDAFDRGNDTAAIDSFADTRSFNLFQPWIAPFDEGTAHHADGDYAEALRSYGAALEVVPRREECTVRINAALAHEALGDAAAEGGDTAGARTEYQRGIDVLAAGKCPTEAGRGQQQRDDAGSTDQRLRQKLQQQDRQQQPQDGTQQQPPPQQQQPSPGQDPREGQLERNNQRGLDQRRQDQDLFGDRDFSRPNSW